MGCVGPFLRMDAADETVGEATVQLRSSKECQNQDERFHY